MVSYTAVIEKIWYQKSAFRFPLLPLSWLYCTLVNTRKLFYRIGWLQQIKLPIPVIVVGNISVGGTGKTPLVQSIVEFLLSEGFRPGIISRGYGGKAEHWPQVVNKNSDPQQVGDEPVLLARNCACPIVVGPNRVESAQTLLANNDCNIIISDDGLQHYRLARSIEIAVIDGQRRLGNGHCLPAGPLREMPSRLKHVDQVVVNGGQWPNAQVMELVQTTIVNCSDSSIEKSIVDFSNCEIHAVAGIGNPKRFFDQLAGAAIKVKTHAFPDHHNFLIDDLVFGDELPILMTEKDAVKCSRLKMSDSTNLNILKNTWYVKIQAKLDKKFFNDIKATITKI